MSYNADFRAYGRTPEMPTTHYLWDFDNDNYLMEKDETERDDRRLHQRAGAIREAGFAAPRGAARANTTSIAKGRPDT